MAGALHKFPSQEGAGDKKPTPSLRPAVVFESFDEAQAKSLLDVAQQRLAGAQTLLQFIDQNRDLARHAGVETIGIELVALMEGDRFSRVIDALEEAVESGETARISTDGLAIIKRIETLLAEASANIRRFTEGDFSAMEIMEAQANRDVDYHRLHLELEEQRVRTLREGLSLKQKSAARQAATIAAVKAAISANPSASVNTVRAAVMGQSGSSESSIWIPLAIFGAIALTAVVIAAVAMQKPAAPQKPVAKKK